MKKILAVTLAMLMVLTSALSAGTAFALTEGSGAEGDYLVVSENFEDSQNKINTYVDQTLQTEKDFSLVSSEVYGIGKAYKSGRSTGRLEAYGNFPVMNTTSQNSKPNFYIETEIDVVLNSEYSGNVQTADLFVVGRQNGGNYDDVAKIILNKETKTFGLTAWATEKAGARTTLDLKVGYELGKTYRIKLVFHATDSNCGAAKEITGVYINGVNALGKNGVPEKYYMVQKASQIENIRMQIANLNLYDNYAMYAYQSADGKSPAVNKGALVSLIRQADTGNEEVIYYAALNAAKVVYENAGATQTEVDEATEALETAISAPTGIKTILAENFEGETYLKFTKDNAAAGSLADSSSVYGLGSKAYKGTSSDISDSFEKIYTMSEAEGYSNEENSYLETEFDIVPLSNAAYGIGLTSDAAADGTVLTNIKFDTDGKIKLYSRAEKRTGSAEQFELCGYEPNKPYRVRIVIQLSDKTQVSCEKIAAVYINGKNMLATPRYFSTHSYGKVGYFNKIRLSNAWSALIDNISITTYQSTMGVSPNPNKGGLFALINNGEGNAEAADSLAAAKLVFENTDATESEIEEAFKDLYNALYYEVLASEDFEGKTPTMFICDATDQSNAVSSFEDYAIGKALSLNTTRSTFHMSPFDTTIVKDKNASGAEIADFKSNKKNLYVETEFDVIIKAQRTSGDERVFLGQDSDAGNSSAEIWFKRDNKIYLSAKDSKNGSNVEKEIGTFEVQKAVRIKIVMHITNENTNESLEEITAVYVNGENVLDKTYYLKGKYAYNSIFINHANYVALDNIAVYRYLRSSGESPIVNKGKLVSLLRSKAEASETAEYIAAKEVYENAEATQAEVNSAYENLLIAQDSDKTIKSEFTWDKISQQNIDEVTGDLSLPTVFASDVYGSLDVAWSSSDPDFISETGRVIRGYYGKEVTLTATLTSGQYSGINTVVSFNVTVMSDQDENSDWFTFLGFGFVDKNGSKSSVPRSGGSVVGARLLSRTDSPATLITAVYTGNGKLFSVDKVLLSPSDYDEALTPQLDAALPDDLSGCIVKAFVWDMAKLMPIMRVHTYNVEDYIISGAKIFIAGDSTAHTYTDEQAPQTGWGQVFGDFVNSSKITVLNYALGGRGAKSFYEEENYKNNIKNAMKNGDYLFVQFGHNDYKNGSNVSEYKEYMKKYISDAKAVGAVPVIITSITRCVFSDGKINQNEQNMKSYVDAAKEVAAEQGVALIDMFGKSVSYLEEIGETEALKLYLGNGDATHFNRQGAEIYAGFIRDLLSENSHSSIDALKDCLVY